MVTLWSILVLGVTFNRGLEPFEFADLGSIAHSAVSLCSGSYFRHHLIFLLSRLQEAEVTQLDEELQQNEALRKRLNEQVTQLQGQLAIEEQRSRFCIIL